MRATRAAVLTTLLLVLATGCGGAQQSSSADAQQESEASAAAKAGLEAATALVDQALAALVAGRCREHVGLYYPAETPAEDVRRTLRTCEQSPIGDYDLEPAVPEDGPWDAQYPGAVEVPFTFTRDGESQHDNLDVVFVDGRSWIVRD